MQLLSGLTHCHSLGILHRGLAPKNILITRNNVLKITNFKSARTVSYTSTRTYTIEVSKLLL